MKLPISERSRKYGYVYWTKDLDETMNSFFKNLEKVEVWFNSSYLGLKKIDRKYRRISVGWAKTRKLPENREYFKLEFDEEGALKISCQ